MEVFRVFVLLCFPGNVILIKYFCFPQAIALKEGNQDCLVMNVYCGLIARLYESLHWCVSVCLAQWLYASELC